MLLALTLCHLSILAQQPANSGYDPKLIQPRAVSEAELRGRGFAEDWEFPRFKADGKPYPGKLFEDSCFRLARQPLVKAEGGRGEIWLGDLLKDLHKANWSKSASKDALAKVKGKVSKADYETLKDLLTAYDLYGKKWNPRKGGQEHGMFFGEEWEFKKSEWTHAKADREVEQIAQLIVADLHAIKQTEADYQAYWDHTKHDWERIEVLPNQLMVVTDKEQKQLMSSATIDFEFDLPFPFSTAEFRMFTLTRMLDDGSPILYLFATGDDLHWLAGYDVYEPVRDRDGNWVGTMMIRVFGLDIDGVPDGRGDRHDNLRGQFGNLRRGAEKLFANRNRGKVKPEVWPYQGSLPAVPVRDGRRD
jgi:hypothetical protein